MSCRSLARLGAAVAFCVILMTGCDRAGNSSDSSTQWVDPKKLEAGPIRHTNLTEVQISRVQKLQKVFSEVDRSPIEKWMEDFKRDANPDMELATWEAMATAYEAFTTSNSLTLGGKKEVFQIVLLRSAAPDDEVLKHLDLKVLSEKDAREIMALFAAKPKPVSVISP
jgi:hypothetical protein